MRAVVSKNQHKTRVQSKISVLAENGCMATLATACKETLLWYMCYDIGWNKKLSIKPGGWSGSSSQINRERPTFVIFGNPDIGIRTKQAHRVAKIAWMLNKHLGLEEPITSYSQGVGNAIYIETDGYYLKSPTGVHSFMTFIRAAFRSAAATENTSSIEELPDQIIKHKHNCSDSVQFRAAVSRPGDNVKSFLEKSLPCMNRDGFQDWRNKRALNHNADYYGLYGIAGYDRSHTNGLVFTEEEIAGRFGWNR